MFGLVLVPIVAFSELGGVQQCRGQVGEINPDFLAFFKMSHRVKYWAP